MRLYDVAAGSWAIYWVNSSRGVLEPPVYGGFGLDDVGILEGPDEHEGRPVTSGSAGRRATYRSGSSSSPPTA